jgi:hypothetical protein
MAAKKVRIRPEVRAAPGNRQGWIQEVEAVRTSQKDGYAIEGPYLKDIVPYIIEIGSILLRVDPKGTTKKNRRAAHLLRVNEDGELDELNPIELDYKGDYLTICEMANAALAEKAAEREKERNEQRLLTVYSDEAIYDEGKRRNLI